MGMNGPIFGGVSGSDGQTACICSARTICCDNLLVTIMHVRKESMSGSLVFREAGEIGASLIATARLDPLIQWKHIRVAGL
jgi:hypothetical protein